jgi:serine/threonine protein kinase/ActR/RegA family two-component response regulator
VPSLRSIGAPAVLPFPVRAQYNLRVEAERATVLVVDDILENRDILGRRLEKRGYRVLQAEDGTRALALVDADRPDLILLDIMMPGITGMEVLERVRRRFSKFEMPILMVTGKDDSGSIVEALALGANDYVIKPVDFPVLLARVQAQMQIRNAFTQTPRPMPAVPAAPAATAIGPGYLLAGKYRLGDPLGTGGFGTVYRAWHLGLERDVAVKVLNPQLAASGEARERFRREGLSACRLKHPNVVSILDFAADESAAYLVMELLQGVSLLEEICAFAPLSLGRCAAILAPLLDALAAAHAEGIIHRDIKPSNIFLERTGQAEVPKLLDFGIARVAMEAVVGGTLTLDGSILGTPAYMAPERLRGLKYDERSDIYSVGVMLYQMLTGHMPFETEGRDALAIINIQLTTEPPLPRVFQPELPVEVEHLLLRTLGKDPDERPTPKECAETLRALALGAPEPSFHETHRPRARLDVVADDTVSPDPPSRSLPTPPLLRPDGSR